MLSKSQTIWSLTTKFGVTNADELCDETEKCV